MGLGGLKAVSLSIARARARGCCLLLSEGKDPILERNAARTTDALRKSRLKTFDQCAAAYINAHRASWKNRKHTAQWESTLANYASPVFGALPVADIDTDLVVKVLRPIWGGKTETAVRLRGRPRGGIRHPHRVPFGRSARRGAAWNEMDLEAKVWTVPAIRMKARKEHRIPLSAQSIAL